jgi:hypothetical protein
MPPDGELYGFPKPVPVFNTRNDFRRWILLQGYPQELIDQGQLDYCRYYDVVEYEEELPIGTDHSTTN